MKPIAARRSQDQLGFLVSEAPSAATLSTWISDWSQQLAAQKAVFIYLISRAAHRSVIDRLSPLCDRGLRLFVCSLSARLQGLESAEPGVLSGLSTLSDLLARTQTFLHLHQDPRFAQWQPTPVSGSPRRVLVVLTGRPVNSPLLLESARIAIGLAAWRQCDLDLLFTQGAADLLNDETVTDLDWESAVQWRQMLTDFRGGLLSQDVPPSSSASLLVPASRVQWLSGTAASPAIAGVYHTLITLKPASHRARR